MPRRHCSKIFNLRFPMHEWLEKHRVHFYVALAALAILAVIWSLVYQRLFAAVDAEGEEELFVVSRTATPEEIAEKLSKRGLYRSARGFEFYLNARGGYAGIAAGAYDVSKNMDAKTLATALTNEPSRVWVTIPEGFRKEQIAEVLGEALSWSDTDRNDFLESGSDRDEERIEGYYFPDTYLLARGINGAEAMDQMWKRFEEAFYPYYQPFLDANIRHDTAVRMASIIQREAAGNDDMKLIAGILWNRLEQGMNLEVDATVQYAVGSSERGWWPTLTREDFDVDSPYNTYMHAGLPLHAISNPGIAAIDAVLYPEETECLYYLHDAERKIHCAKTFEEHQVNIETYLK